MPRQKKRKRSPSPEPEPENDEPEVFDEPSAEQVRYAAERHRRFFEPRSYRRLLVFGSNEILGCDLATMPSDASDLDANRGYRYISCFIDCFNRYAWAFPMKRKTAKECFDTFKKVIADNDDKPPRFLWSDQGQEYLGSSFKKLCDDLDVQIYHTVSE